MGSGVGAGFFARVGSAWGVGGGGGSGGGSFLGLTRPHKRRARLASSTAAPMAMAAIARARASAARSPSPRKIQPPIQRRTLSTERIDRRVQKARLNWRICERLVCLPNGAGSRLRRPRPTRSLRELDSAALSRPGCLSISVLSPLPSLSALRRIDDRAPRMHEPALKKARASAATTHCIARALVPSSSRRRGYSRTIH